MRTKELKAHNIEIQGPGVNFQCREDETILRGLEKSGFLGIPIGCRQGGCGVCKVLILSGKVELLKMSRAHVSANEENDGIALACRAEPRSDISLRFIGV